MGVAALTWGRKSSLCHSSASTQTQRHRYNILLTHTQLMCTDGKWNILLSGQKYKEAACTPNYINLSIFRTQSELLILCYYFTNDDLGNFHSQNIVKSKIFVCRSCSPPAPQLTQDLRRRPSRPSLLWWWTPAVPALEGSRKDC